MEGEARCAVICLKKESYRGMKPSPRQPCGGPTRGTRLGRSPMTGDTWFFARMGLILNFFMQRSPCCITSWLTQAIRDGRGTAWADPNLGESPVRK